MVSPQRNRQPGAGRRRMRGLWALPVTAIGLLFALVGTVTGGQTACRDVVLEQSGGFPGWCLRRLGHSCITLGYVTFGVTPFDLAFFRDHERVHTRQYGVWGLFFLPAYLLSSAWALLRGRPAWEGNWFERQAIREVGY